MSKHHGSPREYTEPDPEPNVQIAGSTDPWLQHPDGTTVELESHLAQFARGDCGDCLGGIFAPTGNGPTEQGIERCDECGKFESDLAAAAALAASIGPEVTVWFLAEDET